jgi:hypothetical protein
MFLLLYTRLCKIGSIVAAVHNHLKIQIAENMDRSLATLELWEMTPVLPWQILQVLRAPAVNKTFCATAP